MIKWKIACLALIVCFSVRLSAQENSYSSHVQQYIKQYRKLAMAEQRRSGVPAAITLGQGILETQAGMSVLVLGANNHFGIKCKKEWTGETFAHTDDAPDECFRKYKCAEDSYKDHSDYLRTAQRYSSLFQLPKKDYSSWARGLKRCGYATNPRYAQQLIKIIEDFNLQEFTMSALSDDEDGQFPGDGSASIKRDFGDNSASSYNSTVQPKTYNTQNPVYTAPKQATGKDNNSFDPATEQPKANKIPPPERPLGNRQPNKVNGLKAVYAFKGDMLTQYALAYGVDYEHLLIFNDLTDAPLPNNMFVYLEPKNLRGMQAFHVIKPGESMLQVSQVEGIQMSSLMQLNHIAANEEPLTGTQLYLQQEAPAKPEVIITRKPLTPVKTTAYSQSTITKSEETPVFNNNPRYRPDLASTVPVKEPVNRPALQPVTNTPKEPSITFNNNPRYRSDLATADVKEAAPKKVIHVTPVKTTPVQEVKQETATAPLVENKNPRYRSDLIAADVKEAAPKKVAPPTPVKQAPVQEPKQDAVIEAKPVAVVENKNPRYRSDLIAAEIKEAAPKKVIPPAPVKKAPIQEIKQDAVVEEAKPVVVVENKNPRYRSDLLATDIKEAAPKKQAQVAPVKAVAVQEARSLPVAEAPVVLNKNPRYRADLAPATAEKPAIVENKNPRYRADLAPAPIKKPVVTEPVLAEQPKVVLNKNPRYRADLAVATQVKQEIKQEPIKQVQDEPIVTKVEEQVVAEPVKVNNESISAEPVAEVPVKVVEAAVEEPAVQQPSMKEVPGTNTNPRYRPDLIASNTTPILNNTPRYKAPVEVAKPLVLEKKIEEKPAQPVTAIAEDEPAAGAETEKEVVAEPLKEIKTEPQPKRGRLSRKQRMEEEEIVVEKEKAVETPAVTSANTSIKAAESRNPRYRADLAANTPVVARQPVAQAAVPVTKPDEKPVVVEPLPVRHKTLVPAVAVNSVKPAELTSAEAYEAKEIAFTPYKIQKPAPAVAIEPIAVSKPKTADVSPVQPHQSKPVEYSMPVIPRPVAINNKVEEIAVAEPKPATVIETEYKPKEIAYTPPALPKPVPAAVVEKKIAIPDPPKVAPVKEIAVAKPAAEPVAELKKETANTTIIAEDKPEQIAEVSSPVEEPVVIEPVKEVVVEKKAEEKPAVIIPPSPRPLPLANEKVTDRPIAITPVKAEKSKKDLVLEEDSKMAEVKTLKEEVKPVAVEEKKIEEKPVEKTAEEILADASPLEKSMATKPAIAEAPPAPKVVVEEKKEPEPTDEFDKLKAKLDRVVYAHDKKRSAAPVQTTIAPAAQTSTATMPAAKADADGYYVVRDGDTAFLIARRFSITMRELIQWNDLDFNGIKVGQRLKVKK